MAKGKYSPEWWCEEFYAKTNKKVKALEADLIALRKAAGVAVETAKNEAVVVKSWIIEKSDKDMKDRILTAFEQIATNLEQAIKAGEGK